MLKIQPSGREDLLLTRPERGVRRSDIFDVVLLEEERRKHVDDAGAERRQYEDVVDVRSVRESLHCRTKYLLP